MPRGGDCVGALVIADLVGQQDLSALRDLDMALGDCEAELVVVLHLVGLEQDRRAALPVTAGRKLGSRRGGAAEPCDDRARPQQAGAPYPRRASWRFGGTCHPSPSALGEVRLRF